MSFLSFLKSVTVDCVAHMSLSFLSLLLPIATCAECNTEMSASSCQLAPLS